MNRLHEMTGISYSDMLFFDDEDRNVESVAELGECVQYLLDNSLTDT